MSLLRPSWDSQLAKVGISLLVFALGFLIDDVMTGVAMFRARSLLANPNAFPTLPDVGFDFIPTVGALCSHSEIESIYLICIMLYTLFRFMLSGQDGWKVFCRFAICDGILMLMRGTTVAVTSLNNPWPQCYECGIDGGCPETLFECVSYTVSRFPFYDCGDLIFSGHTVHFLLTFYSWISYRARAFKIEIILNAFAALFGISMLLSCRFHYTIDIVVAFYFTTFVWFGFDYVKISPTPIPLLSSFARWLSRSEKGGKGDI